MSSYTAAKISEIEGSYGGAFKQVRAALGGSAFGINLIEMPPHADAYPEHDHAQDGQEEIYVVLGGGGVMQVAGDEVALDSDTVVRVGPGVMRKVVPGADGIRMVVVGGVPGKAYEPR